MKLKKLAALFLCLVMILSVFPMKSAFAVGEEEDNLVRNGGFEDGLSGWDNWSNSDKFIATENADEVRSGNNALAIISSSQEWIGLSQDIAVEPHTDYELSFFAKGSSMFCYKIMNGDWSSIQEYYPTPTAEYQENKVSFNSGENEKVVLYISDAAGNNYFDDFCISKVPEISYGIPNPGFENNNLNDWQNTDSPDKFTITDEAGQVRTGSYALKIASDSQEWANITLSIPVKSNYRYKVNFYAKGSAKPHFKVLNAAANMALADGQAACTEDEWTLNSYEFNTKSNDNVVLYLSDVAGETYIDDFELEELEAAPISAVEILNGDFETNDLSGWEHNNTGGKFTVETEEGSPALKIESDIAGIGWLSQSLNVEQGINYRITLKEKGAAVAFKITNEDESLVYLDENTTGGENTFTLFESDSFNPGKEAKVKIIIYDTAGTAFLDDIRIEKAVINPVAGRGAVDAAGTENVIKLVDSNTTPAVKSLFSYLKEVGQDHILFGHQNDNVEAIVSNSGITSDTYHTTGAYPAVVGYEIANLVGNPDGYLAKVKEAYVNNSIITICDHMPNFSASVPSSTPWSDMTPTVQHILPGGKDNGKLTQRLDQLADFAKSCVDEEGELIPIIYRPYHENSGLWFWWGASNTTKDEFINLWRYTVEYLRDIKGVENFLYAYSPNGHFTSEANYLSRFPGDDYVDIIGFDIYHDNPSYEGKWMQQTLKDAQIAVSIANQKGKVAAICEIGLRHNGSDGLAVEDNAMKDWYMQLHDTLMQDDTAKQIAYMMTWRNQDKSHFWVPYNDGNGDKHEMADDFVRFYNQDDVIFADRIGNVYDLEVTAKTDLDSAYILKPTAGETVSATMNVMIGAKAETVQQVQCQIENRIYNAKYSEGYYTCEIDTTEFTDGVYTLTATVERLDKEAIVVNKQIKIKNDAGSSLEDFSIVDDFEGYFGDTEQLNEKYNRNGNGDMNEISLISSPFGEQSGYAMEFKYNLELGGPGYTGTSKTLNYDISSLNATGISLDFKGDGLGEDILLQLNAPDCFEVHFSDLEEFDAESNAIQHLDIPFSSFVKKGHSNNMNLASVQTYAIYINAKSGNPVSESILVFDNIKFMTEKKETPDPEPELMTISSCTVTIPDQTYTGKALQPMADVKLGNTTLVKDRDYKIKGYQNNINAGKASLIITGIGKYKDDKKAEFTIKKAQQVIGGVNDTYLKYRGDKKFILRPSAKGELKFKTSNKKIAIVNKKGSISIKGVGICKITINANQTSNYEAAEKIITLKVGPKRTNISKALSKQKGIMQISWKKNKDASGYVIQYSTNNKFKNPKKVTINKGKVVKKTIKKLKKKTYYVRIRAYKNVKFEGKNVKVYGTYSKAKRVKVK